MEAAEAVAGVVETGKNAHKTRRDLVLGAK